MESRGQHYDFSVGSDLHNDGAAGGGARWNGAAAAGYHQTEMETLRIPRYAAPYGGGGGHDAMLASAAYGSGTAVRRTAPALPIGATEEAPDEPAFCYFGPGSYAADAGGIGQFADAPEPQWPPVGPVGAVLSGRLDVRTDWAHAGVEAVHSFGTVSTVSADIEYQRDDDEWTYRPQCAAREPPKVYSPVSERSGELVTPEPAPALPPCAVAAARQPLLRRLSTESGRRVDTAAAAADMEPPAALPDLLHQCNVGSGSGGAKRKAKRPAPTAAAGDRKPRAKPQAMPDHELDKLRCYRAGRKKGAKEGRATGVVYEHNIQAASDDSDEERRRKRRAANQEYAKRHRQRKQQKFLKLIEIVKTCPRCWAEWKKIQDKVDGEAKSTID